MHSLRGFRNIVKAWKIFHYLNLECGIRGKGEKETEYVDRLREREGGSKRSRRRGRKAPLSQVERVFWASRMLLGK